MSNYCTKYFCSRRIDGIEKILEMMEMKDIALEFINAFDLIKIKGIGKIP